VHTGSLLLFPADPAATPPAGAGVIDVLAGLGLIGEPLETTGVFRAGPGFLHHLTFLGCAPYLVLEPPPDGGAGFSHAVVAGPFATPRLLVGANTAAPRCPACRARFADWRAAVAGWCAAPLAVSVVCPACEATHAPAALDWRESAAAGRLFVEIRNVFPGEAVPGEELLGALERLGPGGAWHYAWVRGLPAIA
jgi:hypothetical protein